MVDLPESSNAKIKYLLRTETATVSINICFFGGLLLESTHTNGAINLLLDSWLKSSDILTFSDYHGINIAFNIGADSISFNMDIPKDNAHTATEEIYKLFQDISIKEDIFNIEKQNIVSDIMAMENNPNYIANKNFKQTIYPNHPYGLVSMGSIESIKDITIEYLEQLKVKIINNSHVCLSCVGNYDNKVAENIEKIATLFNNEKDIFTFPREQLYEPPPERTDEANKLVQQSQLFIAYNGFKVSDPSFVAMKLLSVILHHGMSSFYFNEVREKNGLAYAVSGSFPTKYITPFFTVKIGLDSKDISKTIDLIDNIHYSLVNTITDKVIQKAKNMYKGAFLTSLQTNSSIAGMYNFYSNLGVFNDYKEMLSRLDNTSIDEVLKLAKYRFANRYVYTFLKLEAK